MTDLTSLTIAEARTGLANKSFTSLELTDAHLARIAVAETEVPHLQGELNAMLAFVEQLSEVNVDGVEPMTSVTPMEMKKRLDVVNDGEIADDVVRNAPDTVNHFFVVPKVVE